MADFFFNFQDRIETLVLPGNNNKGPQKFVLANLK